MGNPGEQDQRSPGHDRGDEGRGPQGQPETRPVTSPRPVADVDAALSGALKDYHRARWIAAAAAIAVLAAAVIVLASLYLQQDARLRASCEFWKTLTPLPIAAAPGTARPSKLGVLIVTGSREAYAGQGCGRLPAADPSVKRWAAFYHIRVP